MQWIVLLSAVLCLGLFSELQAHFEPASEAEGVDKDTEVGGNYPFVDLLGQEVHMAPRGIRPGSVAIEEGQPQQQDPSLQLNKLRQETNRSGSHTPYTRSSGHSWELYLGLGEMYIHCQWTGARVHFQVHKGLHSLNARNQYSASSQVTHKSAIPKAASSTIWGLASRWHLWHGMWSSNEQL